MAFDKLEPEVWLLRGRCCTSLKVGRLAENTVYS